MRLTEIRVAGFGGQGVILSAMIIGRAASILENRYATLTQSFGPEARGSACSAQVILDDKPMPPDPLVLSVLETFASRAGAELERTREILERRRLRLPDTPRNRKRRAKMSS